jgi:hypothetical protein
MAACHTDAPTTADAASRADTASSTDATSGTAAASGTAATTSAAGCALGVGVTPLEGDFRPVHAHRRDGECRGEQSERSEPNNTDFLQFTLPL